MHYLYCSFHSRGSEPPSQAQDIIYGSDWTGPKDLPHQEPDHPRLVSSRGHAPPSTAQLKMYPLRYIEQPLVKAMASQTPDRDQDISKFEYGPSSLFRDDFSVLSKYSVYIYGCSIMQNQSFTIMVEHVYCYAYTDDEPSRDMLSTVLGPVEQTLSPDDIDPEFLSLYPVSALMEQSVALPILTQLVKLLPVVNNGVYITLGKLVLLISNPNLYLYQTNSPIHKSMHVNLCICV